MNLNYNIYSIDDLDSLLIDFPIIKTNKKIEYLNVPFVFDIETSSFMYNGEKCACMYAFVFGINGNTIIARTWDDFEYILNKISAFYNLGKDRRVIIWVHNLAYEFQFMRKRLKWEKVFSVEDRKPVQAITKNGIEFRCSYILSGYGLESVGKNLTQYDVKKLIGNLDYKLIRHSETPLTEKELQYIQNDGLVVMAYIQELINQWGNVGALPLTKTGFVRNYCRKACYYSGSHKKNVNKYFNYRRLMNSLQITSLQEYKQLKNAFQGGFTHADALYSGQVVENVTSYDFTSSYPSVMVAEKFPMSKGKLIKIKSKEEFEKYINCYCCLFDVCFYNIESTQWENPLSSSKCRNILNATINNGRIYDAERLETTITEQDYFIYKKFYKWRTMKIKNFRIYKRGYLPTDFIKAILKLYADKTTLKGVEGYEVEYNNAKENLNSCYGMAVTDICRKEVKYNGDEWESEPPDEIKLIGSYNESKKRFLFYPWGIWVTAYARRNLFSGIYATGENFVYADTDSIKIRHAERYEKYIKNYNELEYQKLLKALEFHGLDTELIEPLTKDGKKKVLGFWDFDGFYQRFKTLGAKRYMIEKENGDINFTISGVNKRDGVPYLKKKYGTNDAIFKAFNDGLIFPKDATGKNTHTYLDDAQDGIITDYLGNEKEFHELSSVHMDGAEYELSLSSQYLDFIIGIRESLK